MLRNRDKVLYPELCYLLYGFFFKIHGQLGRFRNEKQYGDALETMLKLNTIPYEREVELSASFEGERPRRNVVDFVIDSKIIVEIKAKRLTTRDDYFQTKRYLVSCDKKLGLLVNFGQQYVSPKRVLN